MFIFAKYIIHYTGHSTHAGFGGILGQTKFVSKVFIKYIM